MKNLLTNFSNAHYDNARLLCINLKLFFSQNPNIGYYPGNRFDLLDLGNDASEKIVLVYLIDIIPEQDFWNSISDFGVRQGRQFFVITDSIVQYPELPNVVFIQSNDLFGLAPLLKDDQYPLREKEPKKLFECTLKRVEFSRLTWFYLFHIRKILDKGYVSFLFQQLPDYSTFSGVDLLDYIHKKYNLSEYCLRGLPDLEQTYQELRDKVPYSNLPPNVDIDGLAMESKYSLALETFACDDNTDRFIVYEKTFRALQSPCIPLIFAQKGMIRILKSIGFFLPDFLDQLDHLPSWFDRQHFLIDILTNDDIVETWGDRKTRAAHNRNLLGKFRERLKQSAFYEIIFDQISST